MLRIERTANGTNVLYRLSGRIEGNDLNELKTLIKSEPEGKRIVLDLKDLILAGRNAVKYLDHVEMADVELINAPAYIRAWIERERAGVLKRAGTNESRQKLTGGCR